MRDTYDPQFDEVLFFPVRVLRITEAELVKRGDLTVHVHDFETHSTRSLGFFTLSLDKVTSSPIRRLELEKTRVYEAEQVDLLPRF